MDKSKAEKIRVLDVGSGDSEATRQLWAGADVVRVDLNPDTEPDVVADVRALPERLGEFDVIFASHILEHLARLEVLPTLRHWAGYLRPGGALHVLAPDIMWAAEEIVRTGQVSIPVMMHIYGSQQDELETHRVGFTVALLRAAMAQAGLEVIHATVGPYQIVMNRDDGERETVEARQIYVVGRRPKEESSGQDA